MDAERLVSSDLPTWDFSFLQDGKGALRMLATVTPVK